MDALFEPGNPGGFRSYPLNSYENRVYRFQDEDRRRFVVKFYRPERWSADQIREEHQFALELVKMRCRSRRRLSSMGRRY